MNDKGVVIAIAASVNGAGASGSEWSGKYAAAVEAVVAGGDSSSGYISTKTAGRVHGGGVAAAAGTDSAGAGCDAKAASSRPVTRVAT